MNSNHLSPRKQAKKVSGLQLSGIAAIAAAGMGMTVLSTSDVQAQELCSNYTVVRGDTLSVIAKTAGVSGGYQFLFSANNDVLENPNRLEVGQTLKIPCADGSLPGTGAIPLQTASQTPAPAAPATNPAPTSDKPIRFVTASGYAPFTDENLPEGGMFTEMVKRTMELGDADQEFQIIFVNDWGSHLTELLPSGAFDMGFPWYLPDCTKVANLSPSNALRCTEYDASEPFYDAIVGYYTLNGSDYASATEYSQLFGSTLCRPDGWFSFDLEGERLVDPNAKLVFAPSEEACWDLLQKGEVDVVTYDALPAEEDISELGIEDQITIIDALASKQKLHVFVPKTNPNGQAYLQTVNAGLEQLRLSGEWFEIIRRQIQTTVEN